jgi:hypothetical protein
VTDFAERMADFFGPFHDLRAADRATEQAPVIAYAAGQALAKRLRAQAASNGIVYPSARRAGDLSCGVPAGPRPQPATGGIWRLERHGAPTPSVTRETR